MYYRVLLFDSHPVIFSGLKNLFEGSEFEVSHWVRRLSQAVVALSQNSYSLIILESRLPVENGLNVLERLRADYPQIPVLIFSDTDNPPHVAQCNALGAVGFRSKNTPKEELLECCRQVMLGKRLWTVDEIRKLTGAMSTPRLGTNYEVSLTNREVQVLGQMAEGATNKEIASGLGISFETVKEHVQHILKKVGVSDRTQAVVWAVRAGII